jgi:hypothetical protein
MTMIYSEKELRALLEMATDPAQKAALEQQLREIESLKS